MNGLLSDDENRSSMIGATGPPANRRVYVVDDEVQVLDVIALQLQAANFDTVPFTHAADFLNQLGDLPSGAVVCDHRMPDIDGLVVQRELQQWKHKFRMIMLSGYPETRVAVQAMKYGAVTVLDKPYDKDHLLTSLDEAFELLSRSTSDEFGLPPELGSDEQYLDRLSERERQVVDLVYGGETNKSIGIQLGISIKTVEKHRGKAMKKMEVNSLAELIRLIDRELHR